MRKLDTSFITTTAGLPGKAGVLNNIQQAHQEIFAALANVIVGNNYDPTKVYVLYGCTNSGSGLTYIITAGAVFYAGEVYLIDAVSFVSPGGQVAVGNIVTTFDTTAVIGDPIQFTDGSSHNVLQIRKVVISSAVTGTGGLPDFANWIYAASPSMNRQLIAAFGTTQTINFRQDQSIFFTAGLAASATGAIVWDFTGAIPGTVVDIKLVAGSGITFSFGTPAGSSVYNLGGAVTSSKTNLITATYVGINEAGNFEVHYSVVSL